MQHLTLLCTQAGEVELLTTELWNSYNINFYITVVNFQHREILPSILLSLVNIDIIMGGDLNVERVKDKSSQGTDIVLDLAATLETKPFFRDKHSKNAKLIENIFINLAGPS